MKFFAVFSAIVAVAFASNPAAWTIHDLSEALQSPSTDVALIPVLEEALNDLMLQAISGNPMPVTSVSTAVQDFSSWTLHELSEALQNPETDPALVPYLEHALNIMIANTMAGQAQDSIIIATPVGLLPIEVVMPAPVETPVVPAPVETPVVAAPSSSPLVQIIVNVKSQEVAAPVEVPVVIPSPVVLPEPVLPEVIVPNPVDVIAVNPDIIVPSPVVLPEPVLPEVIVPNPVDIIAITPPEVNPVDILHPVPVVVPIGAIGVVGPIV